MVTSFSGWGSSTGASLDSIVLSAPGTSWIFLQCRVFLHFLADHVHQLQPRQLQQLDRHLQLGGHDQLLGEFELLSEFDGHGYNLNPSPR